MSDELKEEQEFKELIKKFNETQTKSAQVQAQAEEAQLKIVEQTAIKMVEMKEQVNALKTELQDVKEKLDSVTDDAGKSITILPISHYKKD